MRCRYGDGTVRLTVEQDVLFPFIPNDKVEALRKEPIFQKYKIDPGNLERGLVSCTGAQVRAPAFPTPSLQDCRQSGASEYAVLVPDTCSAALCLAAGCCLVGTHRQLRGAALGYMCDAA